MKLALAWSDFRDIKRTNRTTANRNFFKKKINEESVFQDELKNREVFKTGSPIIKSIWSNLSQNRSKIILYRQIEGTKKWQPVTSKQYLVDILGVVSSFRKKNLSFGERVFVVMSSCYEWDLVEKACFFLGLNLVAAELHSTSDFLGQMLEETKPILIITDNIALLEQKMKSNILKDKKILSKDLILEDVAHFSFSFKYANSLHEIVLFEINERWEKGLAYVLNSSGSTGKPKLMNYSQMQIDLVIKAMQGKMSPYVTGGVSLSWLPLSNLFQRFFNLLAIYSGSIVYFESNPKLIMTDLRLLKPTLLIGVPFFFEQVIHQVNLKLDRPLVAYILNFLGMKKRLRQFFLKRMFGGKLKLCISGSAAISRQTLHTYTEAGIPLYEGYGMSEMLMPIALNLPHARKLGSVGQVLDPKNFDLSESGEVILDGPFISLDSEKDPSTNKLHTNDFGFIDSDGYLFLRGRGDNFLKLSNGRKISRKYLENELRQIEMVENCFLIGNDMRTLSCVLSVGNWINQKPQNDIIRNLKKEIDFFNERRVGFEKISFVFVLFRSFSVESGELTSNLKIKYRFVEKKYKDLVDHIVESRNNKGNQISDGDIDVISKDQICFLAISKEHGR